MASRWQKRDPWRPKSATGAAFEERLANLARRQENLVRIDQLVDLGITRRGAAHRVVAGRLFRVHTGVFAVHSPPYSPDQRYLAAVYACGPGSISSDLCAAHLLGILEAPPSVPSVTNRTGAGRSRPGIAVHRREVDQRDVWTRHGIPCTSPPRTIIDCAHALGAKGTEDLIYAADSRRGFLDRGRLEALAEEHRGRPGIGHVLSVVAYDPKETRNRNERRMLSICREYGVAEPEVNFRIDVGERTFYADFCWPELRLVVEADSWRWHGGRLAAESDADRAQMLAMAGWRVVRFTRDGILNRTRTGQRLLALTRNSGG